MFKKEVIVQALEKAELSNVEIIQEEEGMVLVRFYYDFDEDEVNAAQSFADAEEAEKADLEEGDVIDDEDDVDVDEILEEIDEEEELEDEEGEESDEDLAYDEDEEYIDIPKLRYLSEIAIDQVGETLEEIRDDLDIEIQYVGYDLDEEDFGSYEFVALIFEKDKVLNIEDILDELDM